MSDFTCKNGHAVSIKEKFCSICGSAIVKEDWHPRTYAEYIRELKLDKRQLRKRMESKIPSKLNLGKR